MYNYGITLVIPALNEDAAIKEIVEESILVLSKNIENWEVIVVSDGSKDKTADVAREAGATVFEHPINLGYGTSLKTGIINAKYENIAICDADGTYPPNELEKLFPFVETFDMVVGQRTGKEFLGKSIFKRLGRASQLFLVNFTVGKKNSVPDTNSGLRIFKKEIALSNYDILCGGFSFTTSITMTLLIIGKTVKFQPIDYLPRVGKSHVNYIRDTMRSLQIITHAIIKYNPIKAFLVIMMVPMLVSISMLGLSITTLLYGSEILFMGFTSLFIFSIFMILLIFSIGLVAISIQVKEN